MTDDRVALASLSYAMDRGFTAVADVSSAMAYAGMTEQHRLIGGVAVMLHVQRLGLNLPLRATGDADFGVPPHLLRGQRGHRPAPDRRGDTVDHRLPSRRRRDAGTQGSCPHGSHRGPRTEDRDIEDLWRCLEIAAAEGIEPATFDSSEPLDRVRTALWRELGPNGNALDDLTAGLQADAPARLRTRVRALLTETVGPAPD